MPRYFFDTLDGQKLIDDEGEMLPDDETAKIAAAQIATELTPSRVAHIWKGEHFKVVIRDEQKLVIGYVTVMATSQDRVR